MMGCPSRRQMQNTPFERIMNPPKGMVSPRGPVFSALIEGVEAPDPDTVIVHGKGPSSLLLPIFANGWSVIMPKHILEKDPVNALKATVVGTGPFKLKEPPTTTLWKLERNPDYFQKGLPFLGDRDPCHYGPAGASGYCSAE